ncbi:TIM barrel protein [candidate division KSB3 bacterium]|uniref:TIM barrel protein n=1 Tax=candidate division KSB3 bacterium TaxID=2044937 RepID=A0A9D5JY73_9BACT|nr:TIM barrel protein [candidate division KSB3 bacterium]MBD3326477.1 TIM barrel protein [candidate division KSB3 bacterium]
MNLSIVLSTHAASFKAVAFKGDFETNLARIASYGYDGVELAVRDPKLVDHDQIIALVKQHNMIIPAIGTGQAWGEERLSFTDLNPDIRQQAIDRIKSHIPLAKKANAAIIIGLVRGIPGTDVSEAQANEWMIEGFTVCAQEAAKEGVRIAMEPLNRYETPLINTAVEGLKVIESAGTDNLGLLLDTFHMNIEEPSIEESIRTCGDRIFHFHVADSNRWYPGAGHLDFQSILETLYATGYTGFVSGEFMPDPDANVSAQRAIEYLRGLEIT